MRKLIEVLCVVLLCMPLSNASMPSSKQALHHAMYVMMQRDKDGGARCTAYSIAPHALLTATHCNRSTDNAKLASVDSSFAVDELLVHIDKRISDTHDHTILLISGATFTHIAPLALTDTLEMGDKVFTWGNPGDLFDQYREGIFSGIDTNIDELGKSDIVLLFVMVVNHGDSGSAIFNEAGQIVSTISLGYGPFMGAYHMHFTPEQLSEYAIHGVAVAKPVVIAQQRTHHK